MYTRLVQKHLILILVICFSNHYSYSQFDSVEQNYFNLPNDYLFHDTIHNISFPQYFLEIKEFKEEKLAIEKVQNLKEQGFNAGILWRPDYVAYNAYLVYIGPFQNKNEREKTAKEYQKIDEDIIESFSNSIYLKHDTLPVVTMIGKYFRAEIEDYYIGMPSSYVSIFYNGKSINIGGMQGHAQFYHRLDFYDQTGIPENVMEIIGAWWGGGGKYYYVAPIENGIAIYENWADEGTDGSKPHWSKLKIITD